MTDVDLRLESVWKHYRVGPRGRRETFAALQDINLEVRRGVSFGIIGRNGAGKSTLLKLLARITAPSRGRIHISGRIAALIEVGSGFHPELTGRENVFLSGAILGMRRREIVGKLDRIVEFAGVRQFLDTPVKWYSSGMYVRLGFAIAAHLDPDILLIDEVLAVGDAEFQAKCLQRIDELRQRGVTVLLISHDLTAVERLCERAILLERGQIVADGLPADVVASYHQRMPSSGTADGVSDRAAGRSSRVRLTNLTFHDPEQPGSVSCRTGGPLKVALRCEAKEPVEHLLFQVSFLSTDWTTRFATLQAGEPGKPIGVTPPGGVVEFSCPALSLQPGAYYVTAVVRDASTMGPIHWFDGNCMLHLTGGPTLAGQVYVPHTWQYEPSVEMTTSRR